MILSRLPKFKQRYIMVNMGLSAPRSGEIVLPARQVPEEKPALGRLSTYIGQIHVLGRCHREMGLRSYEAGIAIFEGSAVLVMTVTRVVDIASFDPDMNSESVQLVPLSEFPESIIREFHSLRSDIRLPVSDEEHRLIVGEPLVPLAY